MSRFLLVDDGGAVGLLTATELRAMFREVIGELLKETQDGDEIVTVAQAAERLTCSEPTVLEMIRAGRLAAIDISDPASARRHWRINLTRSLREMAA